MNAAHRPEIQLQLFDSPAVADDFPEAILNEVGVMVGNVIRRTYASALKSFGQQDRVVITMGHINGVWSHGVSVQVGTTGSGFAPSQKWNKFPTMAAPDRKVHPRDGQLQYLDQALITTGQVRP